MKIQTISLKISYDENMVDPPSQWDWRTLLDLESDEMVEIVDVHDQEFAA